MSALWLVWAFRLAAAGPVPPPACPVPDGDARAAVTTADGRRVVARDGALEIDGRAITVCDGLPGPFPQALAVEGDVVFVGFRARGVHRFDAGRFEPVGGRLGPDTVGAVRALAVRDGWLWVGSDRGLWRARGSDVRRSRHPTLGRRTITALLATPRGLHVGAGPYGWWRVDAEGTKRLRRGVFPGCFVKTRRGIRPELPGPGCAPVAALGPSSGLPSAHVVGLAAVGDEVFVGLFDAGVARWRARTGRFEPVPGAPRLVNALLLRDGVLWVGGPKGLWRIDGGRARPVTAGLPSRHINALAAGSDVLWVGTSRGVVGLGDDGTVRRFGRSTGLPAAIVHALAVDASGALWVGTAGGLARLSDGRWRVWTQAAGALPHDWITAIRPDGDGVLVGTYDAGVVRVDAKGTARPLGGLEAAWVNPDGLRRIDGALYVSTLGDGLLRRDADGEVTAVDGLPTDDVTGTLRTGTSLWVATRAGLRVFHPPLE